jgi:hypothetical protein
MHLLFWTLVPAFGSKMVRGPGLRYSDELRTSVGWTLAESNWESDGAIFCLDGTRRPFNSAIALERRALLSPHLSPKPRHVQELNYTYQELPQKKGSRLDSSPTPTSRSPHTNPSLPLKPRPTALAEAESTLSALSSEDHESLQTAARAEGSWQAEEWGKRCL